MKGITDPLEGWQQESRSFAQKFVYTVHRCCGYCSAAETKLKAFEENI